MIAGAHRARPAGLPAEPDGQNNTSRNDSQLTRTTPGSASFGGATLARCSRKPPRVEAVWRDTPGGRHSGSFWRPATPRPCSDGARPRLVSGAFRTVPGPDAPVGGGSLVAAVPAVIRAEAGREAPGAQLPERCSVALVSGVHLFLPGLVWPDRATSSHRLTVGSGTTGAGDAQTCSTSRDRVRRVTSRSPRPLIGFQQGHRNGGEPGGTPSRPAGTR